MWNDYLFMETPDNYLVSLDAKTGKERWHKEIADLDAGILLHARAHRSRQPCAGGTGNDIDSPGFLHSFDPETGDLQWKLYTVPMKKGDPGLDTWASLDAARHGGAQTWIPAHTIPRRSSTFSARAIRLRPTRPARAARATISSPARWWR